MGNGEGLVLKNPGGERALLVMHQDLFEYVSSHMTLEAERRRGGEAETRGSANGDEPRLEFLQG